MACNRYDDFAYTDPEREPILAAVYRARRRASARLACKVEGHLWNPDEVDDDGMAPCLRCDQWVHAD